MAMVGKKQSKNAPPSAKEAEIIPVNTKPDLTGCVLNGLLEAWRAGPTRTALRAATGLDDAPLEEAITSPEFAAALERAWRMILREASIGLLVSLTARAKQETSVARLLAELCGMSAPEDEEAPMGPEAEWSAFERAILDNLRGVVEGAEGKWKLENGKGEAEKLSNERFID
jgi:hypothetical protein